jgi:predicted SprT family Zn-dependent metalloprotease
MSEIICNACKSEIITAEWWNIAKDYEGNYLCDDCDMEVQIKEREGE